MIQNDLVKGLSDDYEVPGLALDLMKGNLGDRPEGDEDEDEDEDPQG